MIAAVATRQRAIHGAEGTPHSSAPPKVTPTY